jgi:tetratricopeptide (TPR) repeat protein
VERIVAIGDVHGAYENLVKNLRATGLVDRKLTWIGGRTHLVQTGDVLDRGADSRRAMDLLMKLESEAERAGGKVHALVGNHEFWNVVGELSYVSAGEFAAFDGPRDRELRAERGSAAAVPGFFAHREAFSAEGAYGSWIRRHNAAVKINGIVFVHGGITPQLAELGLAEINRRIRAELDAPGEQWKRGLAYADEGPLMTRRYSDENLTSPEEENLIPEVEKVLAQLQATAMVMGHTVTFGLITPRFGRRAVLIDVGMLDVYLGGHQAALLVEGNRFYAVHERQKVELPSSLAGEDGDRYLQAVAAAAPSDTALKQRLAGVRVRQGKLKEAADLYLKVGALDPSVRLPYSWRREAGDCFKALGDAGRAEKSYLMYLEGLRTYAQRAGPFGLPLAHEYVRECLRLGFNAEDALATALRLAGAQPANSAYRVTLGRAYLAKGDGAKAVEILTGAIQSGGDSFEAQFILGQALLRQNEPARALEAFRAALAHEPGNSEAQEAMAKLAGAAK